MISDKICKAMNDQIKRELYSSYLYLSMASYLHSQGFDGMGVWMRAKAMEEALHGMKFFDNLGSLQQFYRTNLPLLEQHEYVHA